MVPTAAEELPGRRKRDVSLEDSFLFRYEPGGAREPGKGKNLLLLHVNLSGACLSSTWREKREKREKSR